MEKRRNSFEVIQDILNLLIFNPNGIGPTKIMNHAKVTYPLTLGYLHTMQNKSIVTIADDTEGAGKQVYKITDHGKAVFCALVDFYELWNKNG